MAADPASTRDPELPNLRADVVAGYRAAPKDVVAEVIDGELFTMPRPRPRHARGAGRLLRSLAPFDDDDGDPGGWVILIEPELRLGPKPDIIDPDLAGWRRERFPEGAFQEDAPAFISVPPDWVCEVISESTESIDRGRKMRVYRREGVGHLWLLDPRSATLEVWRLEDGRWREVDTWEGDLTVRAEPFGAVEIDLARLWAR
ncbi:MAG: Uma2 family endonuclease [Minicystis sp.]